MVNQNKGGNGNPPAHERDSMKPPTDLETIIPRDSEFIGVDFESKPSTTVITLAFIQEDTMDYLHLTGVNSITVSADPKGKMTDGMLKILDAQGYSIYHEDEDFIQGMIISREEDVVITTSMFNSLFDVGDAQFNLDDDSEDILDYALFYEENEDN